MKKFLSIALLLLAISTAASAKVQFGVRGGYDITTLKFSEEAWSTQNRNGFYVGPTLKVGLLLGFDLDISAVYDQCEINSTKTEEVNGLTTNSEVSNKRKNISVPLNLRYSIGLGDNFNIFAFAGPQFDFNINKNIDDQQFQWNWEKSTYSVNVGFGIMALKHLEVRANYNIPCGDSSTFNFGDATSLASDGIKCKTGAWQIGAAIYF